MLALLGQHLLFGSAGSAPLLAADLFDLLLAGAFGLIDLLFELLAQLSAGEVAVELSRAVPLAFDLDPGRQVLEIDARTRLIDFLPPAARTQNELLDEIIISDPEGFHPEF